LYSETNSINLLKKEPNKKIYKEAFYSSLFDLATEVYFNRYLSNVVLKDTSDWQVSSARLNQIYGSSTGKVPGFNTWLKEIKLVSDSSLPILEKLS
jgi:hypothetical protein